MVSPLRISYVAGERKTSRFPLENLPDQRHCDTGMGKTHRIFPNESFPGAAASYKKGLTNPKIAGNIRNCKNYIDR